MSARQLTPDSAAAHAVMQSRAGARLDRQLRAALQSMDGFEEHQNLRTITLPKDVDGAMASNILGRAEVGQEWARDRFRAMANDVVNPRTLQIQRDYIRGQMREHREAVANQFRDGVGAWNTDGVVIMSPAIARSMLTAAGAYKPAKGDAVWSTSAAMGARLVNHVPAHELQHSVTPPPKGFYDTPAKWLEEAVAETLSATPAVLQRTARASGVNRHSYAGMMAHEPAVDLGWKSWQPEAQSAMQQRDTERSHSRNYVRSQDIIQDLLRDAGYRFTSSDELGKVRTFLQAEPVDKLPGRLAAALTERWKLDPAQSKALAARIATVVDDEGGLRKLRADFDFGGRRELPST
jgi:hypothetical protein